MKPIKYRVLVAEQLSKADKIEVAAKVATIYTGPEAVEASFTRTNPTQWKNEHWQYEVLDKLGRVAVLKFRGAEVALFFKRQIQEFEPLPIDPIPEGIIKDPNDAWCRYDLFGLSARQVSARVGKANRDLEEELRLAEDEIKAKQVLVDKVETENFKLHQANEKLQDEMNKLKARRAKKEAA